MLRRARVLWRLGLRADTPPDRLRLLCLCVEGGARAASSGPDTSAAARPPQTVLVREAPAAAPAPPPPTPPPPPPPPPPPQWSRRAAAAALLAVSASVGAVLLYRRRGSERDSSVPRPSGEEARAGRAPAADPPAAEGLPAHVHYLLVGAGTASFAALRAIRAAHPTARVLLVGDEPAPPYMRPPLSKELWLEPQLAAAAADPDKLTFRQWNGKRRPLLYEPAAFYTPVERLADPAAPGAALARGWRVSRLEPAAHRAHLELAAGGAPAVVAYDKCLIATGVRAARVPALRGAGDRALPLRTVEDARRLAERLERPDTRHVAVVGGGFLATELAAALAERLAGRARVTQLYREDACLARVLPAYLAEEAARRVRAAGAHTVGGTEVVGAEEAAGRLRLRLAGGGTLDVDAVVEAVGSEPNAEVAAASRLELHPQLGGVLVNAELAARTDHYAAGDVACFYDEAYGRRRVEHHDHAVVSGRLAGENMAGATPPKPYQHQSMLWSDLGPDFGYEAIGIVDSRLPTHGVFAAAAEGARPLDRGVVFYLRERRVVGVLLWNVFNRMHVARQVLSVGRFDDLNEVAKLFTLHPPADAADAAADAPPPDAAALH